MTMIQRRHHNPRSRPLSIDVSKIRVKTENDRLLLAAAIKGNVKYLESI